MIAHEFTPDPHGRDVCDQKTDEDGRVEFCGQRRSEHMDETHALKIQLATALKERDEARHGLDEWCKAAMQERAEVKRLRAALATLDPLPVHVLDEARAGRQSVDWARVVKWMQEEARAALATGGDRG